MLVQRRDELLARADPFDLAQAVDRYVHTLRGRRIRTLMLDACERIGQYYRAEFVQLLSGLSGVGEPEQLAAILKRKWSDSELQAAFAGLLKSNLRAIPMFGGSFCDEVLAYVPTDRAVAIGEERNTALPRAAIFAGVAAALVIAGAAGERYYANARAQSTTPAAVVEPITIATTPAPSKQRVIAVSTPIPIPSRSTAPTPSAAPTAAPTQAPTAAPTQAPTAVPTQAATPAPAPTKPRPTPPPARGVATVVIPDPTPSPEPSALDTTDMPDSYTDATPLPQVTAPQAEVPGRVHLVTPTPKPHHGWLHNSIMHLDPFKPHPRSTP